MRILVGWDDASEVELLSLYLEAGEHEFEVVTDPDTFLQRFTSSLFEAVLFPITFPDSESAFRLFDAIRELDPQTSIMVASRPGEIYALSRLIRRGLSAHVYRDPDGEYMFLLQTLIESALEGKRAEEQRILMSRLREEIDSVRRLQETIIPKNIVPPLGYRIAARYEPSQIRGTEGKPIVLAGGDYYEVLRLDDQRMMMLVGDASGHGMKACMSIMSLHTLVNQLHGNMELPPDQFVSEINRQLSTTELIQSEGGFITLLFGVLEDHTFRWTSAGHCLPVLQNLETNEITEIGCRKADTGPPLGLFEGAEFVTVTSTIPAGHRLLIYTDGLAEAFPAAQKHQEFGFDGIRRVLSEHRATDPERTLQALFDASHEFTEGSGRHDDTSALLLERSI